jgi:sulfate/thiosulfate transport system ATP-binding protein
MSIEVRGLTKNFNGFQAVKETSLKLETGSLTALLGPSGSGKSTLLRMIAGLETPDTGMIHLTGREATHVSAKERNVGFVFQHYALFKHMTVFENIAFGLRVRKQTPQEIETRVHELLRLIQLEGYQGRFPNQLSGGQRQRVAVARALAPRPTVLLLDEPFGALDAKVREELREWILKLHEETNVTTLFVTHDQNEALEVASRILIMNQGVIEQDGTPMEIFDKPATHFIAQFVGETNFIDTEVAEKGLAVWGPFRFSVSPSLPVKQRIRIYFRPNDVYVTGDLETLQVKAKIAKTRFKGTIIEFKLDIGGDKHISAQMPKGVALASGFKEGDQVYAAITAFHVFPL